MIKCEVRSKKYWPVKAISFLHFNKRNVVTFAILGTISLSFLAGTKAIDPAKTIVWKLQSPTIVGGFKPLVFGSPVVVNDRSGKSLSFNGVSDGLVIPKIPMEGWSRFTIEVRFKPDGTGPAAPRFIHFQDKEANRGTFEVRVTSKKTWYLDTFLKNGKASATDRGLTLIDSTIQHPTDQWYWAALVYDGKRMTSYVNGVKELEGDIEFPVMTQGDISLGVRLNKVNWFKGLISEVRFHPAALDPLALKQL